MIRESYTCLKVCVMKVVVVLGDASSSDHWPVDIVEVCVEEWSKVLESKRRRESDNHHRPNPKG